jgi:hypothetical protein
MVSEAIFRKWYFAGKGRIMDGNRRVKLFGARGVKSDKEREIRSGRQQQRYTFDPPAPRVLEWLRLRAIAPFPTTNGFT